MKSYKNSASAKTMAANGKEVSLSQNAGATLIDSPFISRVWHGRTTHANADRFETLLKEEVFPGFARMKLFGYRGVQLLRRDGEDEVEFTTIMWLNSIEDVKKFAGADYETAHIDPKVRSLFTRYDSTSAHYEVRYSRVP